MVEKQVLFTTELVDEIREKHDQGYVIQQHEKFWLGNMVNVKKQGISFVPTEDEWMEIAKCKMGTYDVEDGRWKSGLEYFAETYCKVKREDGSVGQIYLRDYQKEILDLYNDNRFSILMGSRQIGKCLNFNSVVEVNGVKLPIYKIWFNSLDKPTIYDYAKFVLYTAIYHLEKQ